VLMLNAKRHAEEYARALPTSHGWPPFVLVADVGHCVEVYADFSGQGKNYTQFPDRQGFRIFMEDLRKDDVRKRLHDIWTEPQALDPTPGSPARSSHSPWRASPGAAAAPEGAASSPASNAPLTSA